MSATPRTDALEKAVSLGMVGSQLFAEVRKVEKDLEAMTEGLKIASVAVENLRHEVNAHRNAAMEADLRTQAAVRSEHKQRTALQRITELARKEQIGKSDRLMFILECTKKALTP